MALQTDDCDIRDIRMFLEFGGNGDCYINLFEKGRKVLTNKGELEKHDIRMAIRIAMSGGNAPTEVKLAVAALFRAMETAGLNKHPKDEKQ